MAATTTTLSSSALNPYFPSKLLSYSKPIILQTLTYTSLFARTSINISQNHHSRRRDTCFVLCSGVQQTSSVAKTDETQEGNLRKLRVINLPRSFSVYEIKKLFGQCGTVSDVEIIKQMEERSMGFAFVTMASGEEAQAAVYKLDSHELFGKIIRVEFAEGLRKPRPIPPGSTSREFPQESWITMEGLVHCSANYVPLSPISFLERSAKVYRDRTSIVYGSVKFTWSETYQRCLKLASALSQLGVSRGDVVATMAPNVPAMYELHFAVPMAGAVICTLNTRYDANMMSILLKHSEAKIVFVDYQFLHIAYGALDLLGNTEAKPPILVIIPELDDSSPATFTSGAYEYESILANGHDEFEIRRPKSEWDPISVNYTSGTTSRPKGVVFNHRGAYLNSLATFLLHGMGEVPVYLWTVPMFHCNGWCLVWGVAAQGGTNICMRKVTPKSIFDNIVLHNVTNMGGAPTVLNMIVNSPDRRKLPHRVEIMTGGAPPPPPILLKMDELGFGVSHMYGLTETYGPGTYCVWKPEWDSLSPDERSKLKARQGMQHIGLEDVDIKDPVTMESVPADGRTLGEVMFRGNTVMSGYLKDLKATEDSFKGGWFRSGDLAVRHSDGYIEVKDRQKDIIISGGENICTVEVETILYGHPAILEAAVVGRPDDFWGQTPCAFVKLKEGFNFTEEDIIKFCRDHLPHYMAPRTVIFEDLPRTSTGKVQKFLLREKAKSMARLSTKLNPMVASLEKL